MKKLMVPATTLADVVTLLHRKLTWFMRTEDISALLVSCGSSLAQDIRDVIATPELRLFAVNNSCHYGAKCEYDWCQLVPDEILGALEVFECRCYKTVKYRDYPDYNSLNFLPLPHILDAQAQLLEAACHMRHITMKIIEQSFAPVLQLADLDEPDKFRFGTFQPMMFSLTTDESESEDDFTLEIRRHEWEHEQQKHIKRVEWVQEAAKAAGIKAVDTDNVEHLKRLLNIEQEGFGTRFFQDTTDQPRLSYGIVQEHWDHIDVNLSADSTTCRFCASTSNPLLHQHCEAIFQLLKKYMVRHLKHVRYVRPPENWLDDRGGEAKRFLDLIAGFTESGVLCGVYLTDLVSLRNICMESVSPWNLST